MEAEPLKAEPPKRKRRWYQFSLRSLLLATTAIAVACGWLGSKIEHKRKEREAAATIRKLPGAVHYDYQRAIGPRPSWRLSGESYGPAWLRKLLGENFFTEIEFVGLQPRPDTTDDAVDAAIESLKGMKSLQFLSLCGARFNDNHLGNLKGLTQIQGMELIKTKISEAGIEKLRKALPNCEIIRQ